MGVDVSKGLFVRCLLGDVAAEELGFCYGHEHVIIDRGYVTEKWPQYCLGSVEKAVEELTGFREAGGRAMVDCMPCDCGRNVEKLMEVSRRSGVSIVAPTGFHLAKYYPPGHWSERCGEETLAELMVADIEEGIDVFDYSGPVLRRAEGKAGVIKIASSGGRLDERERRIFAAACQASCRTGCPIITHVEKGEGALEQVEAFRTGGVPLGHVVLSHMDRNPDAACHRELLQSGVCLEYDASFRWKAEDGNPTLDLLLQLLPDFPNQILLGMDAARASYWKAYGGSPGLRFLIDVFMPRLREAGLDRGLIEGMFIGSPARAFAFRQPEP